DRDQRGRGGSDCSEWDTVTKSVPHRAGGGGNGDPELERAQDFLPNRVDPGGVFRPVSGGDEGLDDRPREDALALAAWVRQQGIRGPRHAHAMGRRPLLDRINRRVFGPDELDVAPGCLYDVIVAAGVLLGSSGRLQEFPERETAPADRLEAQVRDLDAAAIVRRFSVV